MFWDERGDKYFTNISGDIQNYKYGLKTNYFGITSHMYEEAQDAKEIPEEEQTYVPISYEDIWKIVEGFEEKKGKKIILEKGEEQEEKSQQEEDITHE